MNIEWASLPDSDWGLIRLLHARATQLKAGAGGRLASARSKTGDPKCSSAASAWARHQASPEDFKTLAHCRAIVRRQGQAQALRGAGQEAKAQHVEHIAASGDAVTNKERTARAKALREIRAFAAEVDARRKASRDKAAATRAAKKEQDRKISDYIENSPKAKRLAEWKAQQEAEQPEPEPEPVAGKIEPKPRVFKKPPEKTPEQKVSREATIDALEAKDRLNRAIQDYGQGSPDVISAEREYKGKRKIASKAMKEAGQTAAARKKATFRGMHEDIDREGRAASDEREMTPDEAKQQIWDEFVQARSDYNKHRMGDPGAAKEARGRMEALHKEGLEHGFDLTKGDPTKKVEAAVTDETPERKAAQQADRMGLEGSERDAFIHSQTKGGQIKDVVDKTAPSKPEPDRGAFISTERSPTEKITGRVNIPSGKENPEDMRGQRTRGEETKPEPAAKAVGGAKSHLKGAQAKFRERAARFAPHKQDIKSRNAMMRDITAAPEETAAGNAAGGWASDRRKSIGFIDKDLERAGIKMPDAARQEAAIREFRRRRAAAGQRNVVGRPETQGPAPEPADQPSAARMRTLARIAERKRLEQEQPATAEPDPAVKPKPKPAVVGTPRREVPEKPTPFPTEGPFARSSSRGDLPRSSRTRYEAAKDVLKRLID